MKSKMTTNGWVPAEDPYYYVSNDVLGILERVNRISRRHPVNVLITGRQGCGKSSLVRQYAAVFQRPLATFQVGILSEPGQLFGEYTLDRGITRYKKFLFPEAIQTPNCVIHLEEINRPEHPKALNMLFSLLADDRQVWMDELGLLKVAEGVVFFATLNEGDEFVGTELLDPALRDRFYSIIMDYLPNEVETEVLRKKTGLSEDLANQVIGAVTALRSNDKLAVNVSTRAVLMIGEMVAAGAPLDEALTSTLQVSRDELESVLIDLQFRCGILESGREAEYLLYNRNVAKEYFAEAAKRAQAAR